MRICVCVCICLGQSEICIIYGGFAKTKNSLNTTVFPWCSSKLDLLLSVCCTACMSLGVSQLDSVIIAPPPLLEGETLTLAHLQPLWAELEKIVQSQKAASIGTSDLDKTQLEELYNWAQVRRNCVLGLYSISDTDSCVAAPLNRVIVFPTTFSLSHQ